MLKNYFIILFKKIHKTLIISSINITGLAIALASGYIIFQYILKENSYDKFWTKSENIYRISQEQYQNGILQFKSANTYAGVGQALRDNLPEVEYSTILGRDKVTVYTYKTQIQDINMFWTDHSVFKVFDRIFLDGDINNPFPDINAATISGDLSIKLFGTTKSFGKRFKLNEGWEFYVAGVFNDIPPKSHFHADMLIAYESVYYYMRNFDNVNSQLTNNIPDAGKIPGLSSVMHWNPNNTYNPYNYIRLSDNANPKAVESKISSVIDEYIGHLKQKNISCNHYLQPIEDIHLNSDLENELEVNGNKSLVSALTIVAIIILILGWINFINQAYTQILERLKEIGLRKAFGATRKEVIMQYLVESFTLNVICVFISILFAVFLGLLLFRLTGTDLRVQFNRVFISYNLSIVLIGTILSGLVPIFNISSLHPVLLLLRKTQLKYGIIDIRYLLLGFQLFVSIVLIICTLMLYKQLAFIRSRDLGININQIVYSYSPMSMNFKPDLKSKLTSFKSLISNIPEVESFNTSSTVPGKEILMKSQKVQLNNSEIKNSSSFCLINCDDEFFKTYNLSLIQGRLFEKNRDIEANSVIINHKALKELGLSNPVEAIGLYLSIDNEDYKIIGVVENHHHQSLRKIIEPVLFRFNYQWQSEIGYYSFKIKGQNIENAVKKINQAWNIIYPQDIFVYRILEDSYNKQYESDTISFKILTLFSALALILACSGLLSFSIYTAKKRIREIGIRKVNGATTFEIMIHLNKTYICLVAISFVFAFPIAWYSMKVWLENFAYKTNLSWYIFILTGIIVFVITILTISWQAWISARQNPVEILKYE
jgi:putative ABC transport system permease protein